MCPYEKSLETFNYSGICVQAKKVCKHLMILVSKVPMLKMSGNLFYDPRINVPILKKSGN